jgi:predicted DNA-binding transcriptional regulator AlpA
MTSSDPRPWRANAKAVEGGVFHSNPTTTRLALRADEVAASLGISKRTLQRELAARRFPKPDQHIGRMPIWRIETVKAWLERGGK